MRTRNARELRDGEELDTVVCIVGAGPAGLVLASSLAALGTDVLVLESGGLEAEEFPQTLNEADVVGDEYAGLRATRHRELGGTSHLWNTPVRGRPGAKFAPLDPQDFSDEDRALPGWPISASDLDPYIRAGPIRVWTGSVRLRRLGLVGSGSALLSPDRGPSDDPSLPIRHRGVVQAAQHERASEQCQCPPLVRCDGAAT